MTALNDKCKINTSQEENQIINQIINYSTISNDVLAILLISLFFNHMHFLELANQHWSMHTEKKKDFAEVANKNWSRYKSVKIILFDCWNNYVRSSSITTNAAKSFNIS